MIYREYVYSVAVYISKISNEVGRIDNFRALARKLSFLPTELDEWMDGICGNIGWMDEWMDGI